MRKLIKLFSLLLFLISFFVLKESTVSADYRDLTSYGTTQLPVGDVRYVNSSYTTTPTAIFQLNNNCATPGYLTSDISNGSTPSRQGWMLVDLGAYVSTDQIRLQIKDPNIYWTNNKIYASDANGTQTQLLGTINTTLSGSGCREFVLNMGAPATVRYIKIKNETPWIITASKAKIAAIIVRETYTPFTLSNFAVLDSRNQNPIKIVPEGYTDTKSTLSDAGCNRYPANSGDVLPVWNESTPKYILDLGQKTSLSGIYLDAYTNNIVSNSKIEVYGANRLTDSWTYVDKVYTHFPPTGCQSLTRALDNQQYRYLWLKNASYTPIEIYRARVQHHPTFPSRGLAQLYWGTGHQNDRTLLNVDWWYAWGQDGISGNGPRAAGNGRINMVPDFEDPTACYDYLLIGNEPTRDHVIDVGVAVDRYILVEHVCPNTKLVLGGFDARGIDGDWFTNFKSIYLSRTGTAYSGITSFHFYTSCYHTVSEPNAWVDWADEAAPGEWWATEFAAMNYLGDMQVCPNEQEQNIRFSTLHDRIRQSTSVYAPFTNRSDGTIFFMPGANLIESDGSLNWRGVYHSTH